MANKIKKGDEILFKVKRLHGYHGTVLMETEDGLICRVNEEAAEGDLVIFSADNLVLVSHPSQLEKHHSDRLPYDYK